MGVLARIGKLIVSMRFFDTKHHHKPHVHAEYNGAKASVAIDGQILAGALPKTQMRILDGWLALHEEKVYEAWNNAVQGKPFEQITEVL